MSLTLTELFAVQAGRDVPDLIITELFGKIKKIIKSYSAGLRCYKKVHLLK